MRKHLKTLLILSAVAMPISACSGHLHGNTDGAYNKHSMNCKISKSMDKAKHSAENTLKALDEAAANTTDTATKKRLQKLISDADKLANSIGKCKKMCDVKGKEAAAPAAKATHKKHHAAKTAAPATTAPAAAPKAAMHK